MPLKQYGGPAAPSMQQTGPAVPRKQQRCPNHAANAVDMSRRSAAAWENVSRAGNDSYRRMHAIVHSQMDQISGWMKLQDELIASFEQLRADHDLLRTKIAGRVE